MPIITFWSNSEKTIGQTVSASVAATVMTMEHNYKVLLISADCNNNKMEDCFGIQETNKKIIKSLIQTPQINLDSGITGLMKMASSNRVTPELIHDYTKIIFKNRLEVLYSPQNAIDEKEQATLLENFKNIILNAARYYDQVFVDLKKGLKYQQQLDILNISDVIVENTQQSITEIEKAKAIINGENKINSNKIIWNICKHDKNSKYNVKNVSRTILKKQAVCITPYNTLLLEASEEKELAELLIRFKTLKTEDDNLQFISDIKELNERILLKYQETRM